MSIQHRTFSAPQLSPNHNNNFVQPAPPGPNLSSSPASNFYNSSSPHSHLSTSIFHRNPPRDPFAFSAPISHAVSTIPGSGGLFLTPSVNSHHGFMPAKIGSSVYQKTEAPVMKPPKPPEKPLMPYMRYSRRMWEKVRSSNPDSKLWDIGKIIGQMWRELPDSQRQIYVDEYESEKLEYDRALKAYHNSPSYQAYLVSKNRSAGGRPGEKSSSAASESGVYIQPVEEDESDAGQFSNKQLSASRFHRNHRLMKEIFGETQVPDARNVITAQRLGVLKKQVKSLTLHQNKLEEELKQLESKFETKKRKLDESSTQFVGTLKKLCSHKLEPHEELVEKSKAYLLNAYEQFQKFQEEKQREVELMKEKLLAESQAQLESKSMDIPTESETDQMSLPNQNQEHVASTEPPPSDLPNESSNIELNQESQQKEESDQSAPLESTKENSTVDEEPTKTENMEAENSAANPEESSIENKTEADSEKKSAEDEDAGEENRDEEKMDEAAEEPIDEDGPKSEATADESSENSQEA